MSAPSTPDLPTLSPAWARALDIDIDGLPRDAWLEDFHARLASAAEAEAPTGADPDGARAARRRPRPEPAPAPASRGSLDLDASLRLFGVVLAALSLSVASVQLGLRLADTPAAAPATPATEPVLICRIEGPRGTHELQLIGHAPPPDEVLRLCLAQTGTPTRIHARPR